MNKIKHNRLRFKFTHWIIGLQSARKRAVEARNSHIRQIEAEDKLNNKKE